MEQELAKYVIGSVLTVLGAVGLFVKQRLNYFDKERDKWEAAFKEKDDANKKLLTEQIENLKKQNTLLSHEVDSLKSQFNKLELEKKHLEYVIEVNGINLNRIK